MTSKRLFSLLPLVLSLAIAGCAPRSALPRPSVSVEPLAISQRSGAGFGEPSSAAAKPADTKDATNPADEAAVKRVIEQANNQQAEAFAKKDPSLMRETAVDSYYQELVQINQSMADDGISGIKLLKIEWGSVAITGDTAQATSFETWRTDYSDGSGDEGRERNDYTLVRDGTAWKIETDVHPDSRLEQPGGEAPSSASPRPSAAPSPFARPNRSGQSHNWSGYSASGGQFTAVSGTWTVPQPVGTAFGADATWVGVGGVRSRDLIQAGTEQTVSPSGRVSYQAWIEKLPQVSHPVQLRISPGDSVTVSLAEQEEGTWLVSIKNNTTGQSFQTTEQYQSSHSSAEWVEEAPSGRRGVLSLSNFGTINFSAGSAIKDGKTVSIADAGGRAVTMIDRNDQPIAQPSQLGGDGASFSVTRVNASASQPPSSIPARRPVPAAERPAA